MARSVRKTSINLGRMGQTQVQEVRLALQRGALAIENTAVEKVIQGPKTGRIYPSRGRKGAKHQASAPGQPPAADTGELHTSITSPETSKPGTIRFEPGADTPYAEGLEFGTSKIEPRPFMGPSYDENIGAIKAGVRLAMQRGARKR
jgi:HK97 gp10 family phage protein